jgi:hypothetical protein
MDICARLMKSHTTKCACDPSNSKELPGYQIGSIGWFIWLTDRSIITGISISTRDQHTPDTRKQCRNRSNSKVCKSERTR